MIFTPYWMGSPASDNNSMQVYRSKLLQSTLTLVMTHHYLLAVGLIAYPPNILSRTIFNRQCDDLRSLIRMHRLDRPLKCTVSRPCRFQYQKNFFGFGDPSLPMINRLNPCNDIRAGSQAGIHHSFADPDRFFLIAHRNQDHKNLCW
jgi:hypothetical protein